MPFDESVSTPITTSPMNRVSDEGSCTISGVEITPPMRTTGLVVSARFSAPGSTGSGGIVVVEADVVVVEEVDDVVEIANTEVEGD